MLNILEGYDLRALGHNSRGLPAPRWSRRSASRSPIATRGWPIRDAVPRPTLRDAALEGLRGSAGGRRSTRQRARPTTRRPAFGGAATPAGCEAADQAHGDTIYLTAVDGQGNVVSLIQSLYETFGSGIVAGETGIALHNRGSLFTLEAGHPNQVAPGKRPFHTLIPAMVMKDGRPWLSFGVMGGDMQPQGHVQVLLNLIDFGMNIQEAGEAARFRHTQNGIFLESAIAGRGDIISALTAWAADAARRRSAAIQGIIRDPLTGILMGGSDPRKDGLAIGF